MAWFGVLCLAVLILGSHGYFSEWGRLISSRPSRLHALSDRAQRMFESILENESQVGGAGGSSTLEGLYGLDRAWRRLKGGGWRDPAPEMVHSHDSSAGKTPDFDVVVCGGTLGIFYALALQRLNFKTCVIERGKVAGRPQEWNISRNELEVLVKLGLLTHEELESVVGIEFNPVRVGFKTDTSNATKDQGFEVYVNDILNLGIRPNVLIELIKSKYINQGGVIRELTKLNRIDLFTDTAQLSVDDNGQDQKLLCRLVVDAMGNGSPIAKQIRGPVAPDGICIVVGSCARGFDPMNNTYSDVIYTDTPITKKATSQLQYFWEAFPAGSSKEDRTTYLFTYMDAHPDRPTIEEVKPKVYAVFCPYFPRLLKTTTRFSPGIKVYLQKI